MHSEELDAAATSLFQRSSAEFTSVVFHKRTFTNHRYEIQPFVTSQRALITTPPTRHPSSPLGSPHSCLVFCPLPKQKAPGSRAGVSPGSCRRLKTLLLTAFTHSRRKCSHTTRRLCVSDGEVTQGSRLDSVLCTETTLSTFSSRRLQSSRGTTQIVSLQHRRCCLLKSPNIYQLEFSSQIQ